MGSDTRAEGIRGQIVLATLDDAERLRRRVHPERALLGADAAVALGDGLDLAGVVELVDEGLAVAVAAVGLVFVVVTFGHFCACLLACLLAGLICSWFQSWIRYRIATSFGYVWWGL